MKLRRKDKRCDNCGDPLPKDYPPVYLNGKRLCKKCFFVIKEKERLKRARVKAERKRELDNYDELLREG